jgi:hypothetical protein
MKDGVDQRNRGRDDEEPPKALDLEARDELVGQPKERHVDEEWNEEKQEAKSQNGGDKQQATDEPAEKEVQHAEYDSDDHRCRRAADADVRQQPRQGEHGQREDGQMQNRVHEGQRSLKTRSHWTAIISLPAAARHLP